MGSDVAVFQKLIDAIGQFGLNNDGVAQMAHGLAGILFVVLADYLFGMWELGVVLLLIWASAKEFWLDIEYEKQTFWDGLEDWFFYLVGGGIGLLLTLAHQL